MGELKYFLGLQIKQFKKETFVCQTKYCQELLKRFRMVDAKSIDIIMPTDGNLDKDGNGKDVDIKRYRGMIGPLLYLTASRADILFSVCMCARYQSPPKESHLKVVKRVFRYLHGTSKYGLCYPKGCDFNLVAYSDSDFVGCKSNRKSTSGTCHLFSNSLVSWHSKKQVFVAFSAGEAEFVAADSCCAQIIWLKQ
ncbi:secreted RxLR effector protein 161-like [Vicia villosa]|uniref:secreted RxLR effector protein 161-like n=1 Tax=Vicia villosa TaxID=3911 RepID=UPI00273C1240|nr:secreted RxLR effector protein 161-like [Vicia villosa]